MIEPGWKITRDSWSEKDRLVDFTPEKLAGFEVEIANAATRLAQYRQVDQAARTRALDAIVACAIDHGAKSSRSEYKTPNARKKTKYELRVEIGKFLPLQSSDTESTAAAIRQGAQLVERTKTILAAQAKEEQASTRAKEQDLLQTEAIQYLTKQGQMIGVDFTVANAIEAANNLSFKMECDRMAAEGGLIGFSGEDNCENCGGWDMKSHRCQCGNRRVSWSSYYHSFKSPSVYAEAH